ncbi:MAG: UvrB/UvrC motif-containing protein [Oscillospiraceae bacterium]|nr:UvrB/UvrC motif-containing protein [Oscillospiraceae bacterium]
MKCQKCGKNEINFHYSSNVNGAVTETHLCSECATESGYDFESMFDFGGMFDRFMPIFGGRNGFMPRQQIGALGPFGWSLFGAPMVAFMPQRIAGGEERCMGAEEQGDCNCAEPAQQAQPAEIDQEMLKRREINIMREQMRLAADKDDFEKAAELRDQIRQMEAGE